MAELRTFKCDQIKWYLSDTKLSQIEKVRQHCLESRWFRPKSLTLYSYATVSTYLGMYRKCWIRSLTCSYDHLYWTGAISRLRKKWSAFSEVWLRIYECCSCQQKLQYWKGVQNYLAQKHMTLTHPSPLKLILHIFLKIIWVLWRNILFIFSKNFDFCKLMKKFDFSRFKTHHFWPTQSPKFYWRLFMDSQLWIQLNLSLPLHRFVLLNCPSCV